MQRDVDSLLARTLRSGPLDARHAARFGAAAFTVLAVALVVGTARAPGFHLPPRWYDAQDYENLGYNLAVGRGFGVDWTDPAWRAPYLDPRIRNPGRWLDYDLGWRPRDGGFAETTVRPPALPYLISVAYRLFGRDFAWIRIANALFLAIAIAIAAGLAAALAGRGAGVVAAVAGFAAPQFGGFARLSLTEPLAAALVMLAIVCLCAFDRTAGLRWCALAGATLGLAVLTRSAMLLSLPAVAAGVYVLAVSMRRRRAHTRPAAAFAGFLACAVLVPTPWWARNCATLDAFAPLGAQGGIGLPGAYSDVAYARTLAGQAWTQPNRWGFFAPVVDAPGFDALPPPLQERELARYGTRRALAWIVANPEKLPALALARMRIHWTLRDGHDIAVRLFAAIGFFAVFRRREAWIAAAFVAANSIAVIVTFATDGGRFLAPIEPVLFLFAGVGAWSAAAWVTRSQSAMRSGSRSTSRRTRTHSTAPSSPPVAAPESAATSGAPGRVR